MAVNNPAWLPPPPPLPPCGVCAVIIPAIYTATIMPFEIFFIDDSTDPGWLAADITITVLFFLDMVMTINTGYYDRAGWPVFSRSGHMLTPSSLRWIESLCRTGRRRCVADNARFRSRIRAP